jgi:hypothetical protein
MKLKEILRLNENSDIFGGLRQLMDDETEEGFKAKILLGRFGGIIKAQFTDKTWPDGAPVMKNFTRNGKKDVSLKGDFYLIDSSRGWWYVYGPKKMWYAIKHSDYSTPPFEI